VQGPEFKPQYHPKRNAVHEVATGSMCKIHMKSALGRRKALSTQLLRNGISFTFSLPVV
jgi:hypothetical protein